MRDPGETKPEVERCCFGVSCHFSVASPPFSNGPSGQELSKVLERGQLCRSMQTGCRKREERLLLISEGRFFVSESLMNQQQHTQTKAAGEEREREAGREGVRDREGRERTRGRESWLSCGRDDATN